MPAIFPSSSKIWTYVHVQRELSRILRKSFVVNGTSASQLLIGPYLQGQHPMRQTLRGVKKMLLLQENGDLVDTNLSLKFFTKPNPDNRSVLTLRSDDNTRMEKL